MVLQHARSSFHVPWDKVEASRIVATSGAIALNIVVLLLLLVPAARVIPQPDEPRKTITVVDLTPTIIPPPTPPPPIPVPVQPPVPTTPTPPITRTPDPVLPTTDDIVVPDGTLPAPPTTVVPTQTAAANIPPPADPIPGVRLEYGEISQPIYPREALRDGLQGTVLLQVLVDVDGKPIRVDIYKSSGHRILDEAARRHVLKRWTFRPAMKDGNVVQALGLVPIDFKM